MSDKEGAARVRSTGMILSASAPSGNAAKNKAVSSVPLGQRYPHPCPDQYPQPENESQGLATDVLGTVLTIRDVATMFGCSAWTVRQRLVPLGLPHLRLTPNGKLMFFHNQIVRWVLDRQRQKGGYIR